MRRIFMYALVASALSLAATPVMAAPSPIDPGIWGTEPQKAFLINDAIGQADQLRHNEVTTLDRTIPSGSAVYTIRMLADPYPPLVYLLDVNRQTTPLVVRAVRVLVNGLPALPASALGDRPADGHQTIA